MLPIPQQNIFALQAIQCSGLSHLYGFGAFVSPGQHAAAWDLTAGQAWELDGGLYFGTSSSQVRATACTSPACDEGLLVGGLFDGAGNIQVGNITRFTLPVACRVTYSDLVTTTVDVVSNDGFCSLREAVLSANTDAAVFAQDGECAPGSGSDFIRFHPQLGAGIHRLNSGQALEITSDIQISGLGRQALRITSTSAAAAFNVLPGARLGLDSLSLSSMGTSPGLILADQADLELTDVRIVNTQLENQAAAVSLNQSQFLFLDSEVYNVQGAFLGSQAANVQIIGSLFSRNSQWSSGLPHILAKGGSIEIDDSEFRWNRYRLPLIAVVEGELEMRTSSVYENMNTGNSSQSDLSTRQLLAINQSEALIENNSFFLNFTGHGSTVGLIDPVGTSRIRSNTVYNNYSRAGSHGLHLANLSGADLVELTNNLLMTGKSSACRLDGSAVNLVSKKNFSGSFKGGCPGLSTVGWLSVFPAFYSNDPTPVLRLPGNSPLIDAGDNASCPATDQRGMPRPIDGNHDGTAECDVGAYEYQ